MPEELTVRSHGAAETARIRDDVLVRLWETIYRDLSARDPFYTTDRFLERLDGYTRAPGFSLCTATTLAGEPVGLAFGYPLPPGSHWWDGLLDPLPPAFTVEDGHRTFAINEIMVVPTFRRRGVAGTLHRRLLAERPERRATLLVDPDNRPARAAYLRWGWHDVGPLKPFPDSPTYLSMLLPLPLPPLASETDWH